MVSKAFAAQVILCSCPDEARAQQIAQTLVLQKQAKCVSVLSPMTSVFMWENKLQTVQEYLLVIKAPGKNWTTLEKTLKKLHPYTVPEILALPISHLSDAYRAWLMRG